MLLASILFVGVRLVRRANRKVVWKAVQVVFVLILSFAFYNLISQTDVPEIRRFFRPLVNNDLMVRRLLVTITLMITVFVTLVALLKLGKELRENTLVLLFQPFAGRNALSFSAKRGAKPSD